MNGFSALVRLEPGDSGDDVAALQEALAKAGFYHWPSTVSLGAPRPRPWSHSTSTWGWTAAVPFSALDWIRLALLPDPGLPSRWSESDYIEVDLARQLLFLVEDGELARVMPVSTGGGYAYTSPRTGNTAIANPAGRLPAQVASVGMGVRSSATGWCVYKYWAFSDYYGIHGYRQVPTYPASHGCIRVETWDADWVESHLAVGMPLHVWRQPPAIRTTPGTARKQHLLSSEELPCGRLASCHPAECLCAKSPSFSAASSSRPRFLGDDGRRHATNRTSVNGECRSTTTTRDPRPVRPRPCFRPARIRRRDADGRTPAIRQPACRRSSRLERRCSTARSTSSSSTRPM